MSIKLCYKLNVEGQKQAVLAGVPAHAIQEYEVGVNEGEEHRLTPDMIAKAVKFGDVDRNGHVVLTLNLDRQHIGYELVEERDTLRRYCNDTSYVTSCVRMTEGFPFEEHQYGASRILQPQEVVEMVEQIKAMKLASRAAAKAEQEARAPRDMESLAQAEAALARWKEVDADNLAKDVAYRQAKEAAEAAKEQERYDWIEAKGSERLKLAVELGLLNQSLKVYEEERLGKEHPGFIFDRDWHRGQVEYDEVINPTLPELQALKTVRETLPEAELQYAELDEYGDSDGRSRAKKETSVRERVITAIFLDQRIVKRLSVAVETLP